MKPVDATHKIWPTLVAGLLLAGAIGWLDYVTGPELGIFVFFFLPVGLVGWHIGSKSAITLSIVSALLWALAGSLSGRVYSNDWMPVWNTLIRLMAFLVVGIGSSSLSRAFAEQRQTSRELARALSEIKTLTGLLPICASCKKIRDENGQWQVLEKYFGTRADVQFSHGVCPDCAREMIRESGLPESLFDDRHRQE